MEEREQSEEKEIFEENNGQMFSKTDKNTSTTDSRNFKTPNLDNAKKKKIIFENFYFQIRNMIVLHIIEWLIW